MVHYSLKNINILIIYLLSEPPKLKISSFFSKISSRHNYGSLYYRNNHNKQSNLFNINTSNVTKLSSTNYLMQSLEIYAFHDGYDWLCWWIARGSSHQSHYKCCRLHLSSIHSLETSKQSNLQRIVGCNLFSDSTPCLSIHNINSKLDEICFYLCQT